MELLWTMSLGGTAMVLSYLVMKFIFRTKWNAVWRYFFLKVSLLCFLLPIPEIRYEYELLLRKIPIIEEKWQQTMKSVYEIEKYANKRGMMQFLSNSTPYIALMMIAIIALFIFHAQYKRYEVYKKGLRSLQHIEMESIQIGRRKVKVLESQYVSSPLTLGVRESVILLPEKVLSNEERKLVLEHEKTHIRYGDIIISMMSILLIGFHWFNPFAYYLCLELRRVSELACDARVVNGLDEKQRKQYGNIIITMAEHSAATKKPLGAVGFSDNKTILKERIMGIKKTGKTSKKIKVAITCATTLCMLFSSLTVFAYNPDNVMELPDEVYADIQAAGEENVTITFVPQDVVDAQAKKDFHDGIDKLFIADNGEVFEITENDLTSTYAYCSHKYVDGTANLHFDNGDGSCTVNVYSAKRCSACGDTVMGGLIRRINYDPCPH